MNSLVLFVFGILLITHAAQSKEKFDLVEVQKQFISGLLDAKKFIKESPDGKMIEKGIMKLIKAMEEGRIAYRMLLGAYLSQLSTWYDEQKEKLKL